MSPRGRGLKIKNQFFFLILRLPQYFTVSGTHFKFRPTLFTLPLHILIPMKALVPGQPPYHRDTERGDISALTRARCSQPQGLVLPTTCTCLIGGRVDGGFPFFLNDIPFIQSSRRFKKFTFSSVGSFYSAIHPGAIVASSFRKLACAEAGEHPDCSFHAFTLAFLIQSSFSTSPSGTVQSPVS